MPLTSLVLPACEYHGDTFRRMLEHGYWTDQALFSGFREHRPALRRPTPALSQRWAPNASVVTTVGFVPLAGPRRIVGNVADGEDVRRIAMSLPRTTEHLVRDHTKYRIGRIVYAAVSPDEERLGFGFPKEERAALVASEPDKFMMPLKGDERYNWVRAQLPALNTDELRELLTDAWCMCVSKKTAAAYLETLGVKER